VFQWPAPDCTAGLLIGPIDLDPALEARPAKLPLLDNVNQLMGEELSAPYSLRGIFARTEGDFVTDGESPGIDQTCPACSRGIRSNSDPAEIVT
jgi:hypothetical protein